EDVLVVRRADERRVRQRPGREVGEREVDGEDRGQDEEDRDHHERRQQEQGGGPQVGPRPPSSGSRACSGAHQPPRGHSMITSLPSARRSSSTTISTPSSGLTCPASTAESARKKMSL